MHNRKIIHMSASNFLILTLVGMLSFGGGNALAETAAHRPGNWAIPLAVNAGLPNLNRVNAMLYRSAQPSQQGFAFLNTFPVITRGVRPIKTILSLRAFHDDALLLPPGCIAS